MERKRQYSKVDRACRTFGDVRWNADGGAPDLCGETESLGVGKQCGERIHRFNQVHGILPDLQALMRPLERFPISHSRFPATQAITNMGSSNSTGWPFSTRMACTVPATSASIWLNIFIASMMPSVSPALTCWPTLTKAGVPGVAEA